MERDGTIKKAVRVLRAVAGRHEPSPLAELSRTVDLPKPTTYRLCRALEEAGVIVKDPLTRRYQLGESLEQLAFDVIRNGLGHRARKIHMERLAERVGERVNLGVLCGSEALYVEWVETTAALRVDVRPDTRLPVHASANGKLLLAHAPFAVRQRILAAGSFPAFTKNTITTALRLAAELDRIRERGWAEDNEEFLDGVICVAAPVRNRQGQVVAGVAIMAPSARLSLEKARTFVPDLLACANALSAELSVPPSTADERAAKARRRSPRSRSANGTS